MRPCNAAVALVLSSPPTLLRAGLIHPGSEALASSSAQPGCKDELRSGGLQGLASLSKAVRTLCYAGWLLHQVKTSIAIQGSFTPPTALLSIRAKILLP
jgi:hypothetical protein